MDLREYLQSAKESLFRFEYLQEFDVPEERELFRTYKIGTVEVRAIMQDWWKFLEKKHDEGVKTERVRLIREPLTDYLKWELQLHLQTTEHGDDIRVLNEDRLTPDLENLGDFWLIDSSVAVKMEYDSTGRYIGCEVVEPQLYIEAKQYLLGNSTPLANTAF